MRSYLGMCFSPSLLLPTRQQIASCENKRYNTRVASIALGITAIALVTISCILYGIGSFSPTFMSGLGLIPYLGGIFVGFIAVGVLVAACVLDMRSITHKHHSTHAHFKPQSP